MLDLISACRWLFLDDFSDTPANNLRLILKEGRTQDEVEDVEIGGVVLTGTRAIEHDESCRVYELVWSSYICYIVRNESYVSAKAGEEHLLGQRIRMHTQSTFLNYVAEETFASSDFPGPFSHMEVVCENHVIDIASIVAPTIRLIKPGRPRGV